MPAGPTNGDCVNLSYCVSSGCGRLKVKDVVNRKRPKHNLILHDLTWVILGIWTKDNNLIYIHEQYWVQFTLLLDLYCWTGARLSTFFTGGLQYRVMLPKLPLSETRMLTSW